MVNRKIKAVLKGDRLQTKDVFVPKMDVRQDWFFDHAKELKMSAVVKNKLNGMDGFSSVMEEIREDNHVSIRATVYEKGDFFDIIIYMDSLEIACEKNGVGISKEEVSSRLEVFHRLHQDICIMVDEIEC